MKEIEFRGKSLITSEWVYGYYYNMPDGRKDDMRHLIVYQSDKPGLQTIHEPVGSETVSQYIGIKDIHQKKVFQGNIVKIRKTIYTDCSREELEEIREFTGEVIEHQYSWCIAEKIEDGTRYYNLFFWNIEGGEDDTMEIIGNRWDNPELAVI